jgi:hypothetical protein
MNLDDVYRLYLAVRLHFTSNYDIVKYKGVVAVKPGDVKGRIRFSLEKIAKEFKTKPAIIEFFVSNHVAGDSYGGVFSATAHDVYLDWRRRVDSLRYLVQTDLRRLQLDFGLTSPTQLWTHSSGEHPILVKELLGGRITLETAIVLNKLYKYIVHLDDTLADDIFWHDLSLRMKKYSPFLRVDCDALRTIVNNIF